MDLLSFLSGLLGTPARKGAQVAAQHILPTAINQSMAQASPMTPPDITYDPTGRTPYSARTPELARLGNQYVANPTAPQFLGVDPALFGFPADNTARRPMIQTPGITGASNPLEQLRRGGTFYSPGEGPRTNFFR